MAIDPQDSRALLQVAPGDYVAERTRLAKAARALGDKARAVSIQALKRPTLGWWAVIAAAADDPQSVRDLFEATSNLAVLQSTAAASSEIAAATLHRKRSVDAIVQRSLAALLKWDLDADPRRQEIRDLIDQLSRHRDVETEWLDGSLRELPTVASGFDAFAHLEISPRSRVERSPEPTRPSPPIDELAVRREAAKQEAAKHEAVEVELAKKLAARRAVLLARAEAAVAKRQAELDAAVRERDAAQAALDVAKHAFHRAEAKVLVVEVYLSEALGELDMERLNAE